MKMFLSLVVLSAAIVSHADTGETQTYVYDGSRSEARAFTLFGEKTHTEYKVTETPGTCFRQELTGMRTVCSPNPYDNIVAGRRWGTRYGGRYNFRSTCYQEPVYRQVAYNCTNSVRTPVEVVDSLTNANVRLNIKNESSISSLETFKVTLNGDRVSLTVEGSKKFLVVLTKESIKKNLGTIEAEYTVELIPAKAIEAPLKISDIAINDSVLNLRLDGVTSENVSFELNITRLKTLTLREEVLGRKLSESEVVLGTTGASTDVTVAFDSLNVRLSGGKYNVTAKAFYDFGGKILNKGQFTNLETSKSIIYNR